jgi:hypothetical protein
LLLPEWKRVIALQKEPPPPSLDGSDGQEKLVMTQKDSLSLLHLLEEYPTLTTDEIAAYFGVDREVVELAIEEKAWRHGAIVEGSKYANHPEIKRRREIWQAALNRDPLFQSHGRKVDSA